MGLQDLYCHKLYDEILFFMGSYLLDLFLIVCGILELSIHCLIEVDIMVFGVPLLQVCLSRADQPIWTTYPVRWEAYMLL